MFAEPSCSQTSLPPMGCGVGERWGARARQRGSWEPGDGQETGRGEGKVLVPGAWWDPSPGWSLLTATVVDGGWPWRERRLLHAPALTRALGSCLCSWDHKNSWDKFLARSASLCLGWRKSCRRVGQKVQESWRGAARSQEGCSGMWDVLSLFLSLVLHEVQSI